MCQFWLSESDGYLMSPYFHRSGRNYYSKYGHNLNCTWIINAKSDHYINLEITNFEVKCQKTFQISTVIIPQ